MIAVKAAKEVKDDDTNGNTRSDFEKRRDDIRMKLDLVMSTDADSVNDRESEQNIERIHRVWCFVCVGLVFYVGMHP